MSDYDAFLDEVGLTRADMVAAAKRMPPPLVVDEDSIHKKQSPIHGIGIASGKAFAEGDHVCTLMVGDEWTECGRWMNHALAPNVRAEVDGGSLVAVAVCPIADGDEIVINYRSIMDALGIRVSRQHQANDTPKAAPGAVATKHAIVIDGFCADPDKARASALQAGFGVWRPETGVVGSSVYEGMCYCGDQALMVAPIVAALGVQVFPNHTFFRITRPGMERAYIHSDSDMGSHTCVAYMSEHAERYGTALFRHKPTGLVEMPPANELQDPKFDGLRADMVSGDENAWEMLDYIEGRYNRAVIFHAPLFHARMPMDGIGTKDTDSRMVWVCHFYTARTLSGGFGHE